MDGDAGERGPGEEKKSGRDRRKNKRYDIDIDIDIDTYWMMVRLYLQNTYSKMHHFLSYSRNQFSCSSSLK